MAIEKAAAAQVDPVSAQVLRTHLEAIAEEGFRTIERTAISPVVTESLDAGCTIVDAEGGLITGGGRIPLHYGAACAAVRSVLAVHGSTLAPGDVFFGNDPHSGIAVHPQDVIVAQPVFVKGELAAWIVNSAHLSDMGGMSFGSWAPMATECYQEALRMPPVRLFAQGVEQGDIWAILRNNVRLPVLDEMDLRGLVAGCHVAQEKLTALIESKGGLAWFHAEVRGMQELTERELRRRIALIADGTYRARALVEWETTGDDLELYPIPCTLTVIGDRLIFDYDGVGPQCSHYINSKPWIVQSGLVPDVWSRLGQDLPLNQGVLEVVEVRCPPRSLLNSEPPAPIGAAHNDAANLAALLGTYCLSHALAASESPLVANRYLTAQSPGNATATQVWRLVRPDGEVDAALMLDGIAVGSEAASQRDGNDLTPYLVARNGGLELTEVEVLEWWYPILIIEKCLRSSAAGAGRLRAGAGCQMSFRPHRTDELVGVMYAKRARIPFLGIGGGMPGATTRLVVHRADGAVSLIAPKAEGVRLGPGDVFQFRCSSGGGYGDPLDRDPAAVARDVALGRLTASDAREVHGVVIGDAGVPDDAGTAESRSKLLQARLARARPARQPLDDAAGELDVEQPTTPLYPGVIQRGRLALCEQSGAPLAIAPDHWTEGCPVLADTRESGVGTRLCTEMYLDPRTGRALFVDARLDGQPRSFTTLPRHWVEA